MIQVRSIDWDSKTETFSIAVALIILSLIVAYPFFTAIFLLVNYKKLEFEKFEQSYGSLYENVKIHMKMNIFFSFLFLLRRLIFCLAAVFLEEYPFLQYMIVFAQSLIMILFIVYCKPFVRRIFVYQEIFNEVCILVASYHMIMFSNYVNNEDIQYYAGWSLVLLVTFNIFTNMSIIIVQSFFMIKLSIQKLRVKINNCRNRKQKKYLLDETYNPLSNTLNNTQDLCMAKRIISTDMNLNDVSTTLALNRNSLIDQDLQKQFNDVKQSLFRKRSVLLRNRKDSMFSNTLQFNIGNPQDQKGQQYKNTISLKTGSTMKSNKINLNFNDDLIEDLEEEFAYRIDQDDKQTFQETKDQPLKLAMIDRKQNSDQFDLNDRDEDTSPQLRYRTSFKSTQEFRENQLLIQSMSSTLKLKQEQVEDVDDNFILNYKLPDLNDEQQTLGNTGNKLSQLNAFSPERVKQMISSRIQNNKLAQIQRRNEAMRQLNNLQVDDL
eukprot:403354854